MKTTKGIYLAAIAAMALTSCSNTEDQIFDQSAAERLEQYKKDYSEVLTENGGLWTMEYFSNPEEPGYVFVVKFDKNGSVTISANHKWIGGTFKQETSLWKMIADNGPVLSFNSYNTLFHIFSDPADITGSGAPTNDGKDIIETGYGHAGDYEFQVMEVSEDRNTVRLLGKKRMYDIYLHRLDAGADAQDVLDKMTAAFGFISPYFNYFNMKDANGEEFIINDFATGVLSVYPKAGDKVSQTRTCCGIVTVDGFRFIKDFEVARADETADPLVLNTFRFQEDGSLKSDDGVTITGPYPTEIFLSPSINMKWVLDTENCGGEITSAFTALVDGIKTAYPSRKVESAYFTHEVYSGKVTPCVCVKLSGTKAVSYYIEYTSESEEGVSFNVTGKNSQATTFEKKTTAIKDFAEALSKMTYAIISENVMKPEILDMKDTSNSANYMKLKVE